jgi:ATP-dependent Clp protease ATP-binding subunit ClpA
LFSERESHAVFFLQEQDMTRFDAVNYISHGIAKVPGQGQTAHAGRHRRNRLRAARRTKAGKDALDAYCVNLNQTRPARERSIR